jgi:hypothetical protein
MLVLHLGTLTAAGSMAGMPCSASLPLLDMLAEQVLSFTLLAVLVEQHKQTTKANSSCSVASSLIRRRSDQAPYAVCWDSSDSNETPVLPHLHLVLLLRHTSTLVRSELLAGRFYCT